MVRGSTSFTFTPPLVMTAWARSPRAVTGTVQCFISFTRRRRLSLSIWLAFSAGSTPQRSTITGCMLAGSSFASAPWALFAPSSWKSRPTRA